MRAIASFCAEFAAAPLLLIPLFLILNKLRFHNGKTTFLYTLLAIYLAGVWAVVGLPNVRYLRFDLNFNFIPFTGMTADLRGTVLNVVLFLPLGFFLTLLWKRFRSGGKCALFGFGFSLAIEILQMFTFRATDVDDLMTNTLGTLLGWLLGWVIIHLRPGLALDRRNSDLLLIFGAVFGVMFFMYPFLYPVVWDLIF